MPTATTHDAPLGSQPFSNCHLLLWGILVLLGTALRLYQLDGQIIGDDEWHAINVATNSSYHYILTHFHPADNCIPLTFIDRVFVDTIGLNEFTLHGLQAAVGVALLVVVPLLARQIVGRDIALIFTALLATSPFLVYYSRFARPYIFVVFLSSTALLALYLWLTNKKTSYAITYIFGTILSSYFSQISFPALAAPLIFALYWAMRNRAKTPTVPPPFTISVKEVLAISLLIALGILLWLVPTLGSLDAIGAKVGAGEINRATITGSLQMFSGSGRPVIVLFALLAFLVGMSSLYRTNKYFFAFCATIILVQALSTVLLKPQRVELAHVFTRYNITSLPLYLLAIAIGFWQGIDLVARRWRRPKHTATATTIVTLGFLLTGILASSPFRTIYAHTNNFTNHDDFQYGYDSLVFQNTANRHLISKFYRDLDNEAPSTALIEFPFVLWWSGNFFHLYQQVHHKRVQIGFWEPYYLLPPGTSNDRVKLRNFINIGARDALIASGAKYLIIHKDIAWELRSIRAIFASGEDVANPSDHSRPNIFEDRYGPLARQVAQEAVMILRGALGEPYYEDQWLTVFKTPGRETVTASEIP